MECIIVLKRSWQFIDTKEKGICEEPWFPTPWKDTFLKDLPWDDEEIFYYSFNLEENTAILKLV